MIDVEPERNSHAYSVAGPAGNYSSSTSSAGTLRKGKGAAPDTWSPTKGLLGIPPRRTNRSNEGAGRGERASSPYGSSHESTTSVSSFESASSAGSVFPPEDELSVTGWRGKFWNIYFKYKKERCKTKELRGRLESLMELRERELPLFLSKAINEHANVLGGPNDRGPVSKQQDSELFHQFMDASKIKLPEGFERASFIYAPVDCGIRVAGKKEANPGALRLVAWEFNDTGYAGIRNWNDDMVAGLLDTWRAAARSVHEEHENSGSKDPLLILVGSSGREESPDANNKTMEEKVMIATTLAQEIGAETMDMHKALGLMNSKNPDYWPPKGPTVITGYATEFTSFIKTQEHGDQGHVPTFGGVPVGWVVNGRTAANMQKKFPELANSKAFRISNATNVIGTDKGAFMALQKKFNESPESFKYGKCYGLEDPVCFEIVSKENLTDEQAMDKLVDAAAAMPAEHGVAIKPSGTGGGKGIVFTEPGDDKATIRKKLAEAMEKVKKGFGEGAGYPWTVMPKFEMLVIDGHQQEIRMVVFQSEGYMYCVPSILKKSKEGELVNNITAQDAKLTVEERNNPDKLLEMIAPALNRKVLDEHGLDLRELMSVARYLAALAVEALNSVSGEPEHKNSKRARSDTYNWPTLASLREKAGLYSSRDRKGKARALG